MILDLEKLLPIQTSYPNRYHATNNWVGINNTHQKPIRVGVKMSALIEGFKKEHSKIIETFKKLRNLAFLQNKTMLN